MIFQFRWSKALLTIGSLLFTACSLGRLKSGSGSSESTGSNGPSKISTAFSPSSDARKDLREALMKLNTAYPYRLTETTSATANGQMAVPESTRVVEFAAADRSHMKWTGGPGGGGEAISIGDKHYWYANGAGTPAALADRENRAL